MDAPWFRLLRLLPFVILVTACGGSGGQEGGGPTDSRAIDVDAQGGLFSIGGVGLRFAPAGLTAAVNVSINTVPLPEALPTGLQAASPVYDVDTSNIGAFEAPAELTFPYNVDPSAESRILVLHHDELGWEPATIVGQDFTSHTVTISARDFSAFVVVVLDALGLGSLAIPESGDTGFIPSVHGWGIRNWGVNGALDGFCAGFACFARWFFLQNPSESLFASTTTSNGNSLGTPIGTSRVFSKCRPAVPLTNAHLLSARAHFSEQALLNRPAYLAAIGLLADAQGTAEHIALSVTLGSPALVAIWRPLADGTRAGHALLAYSYSTSPVDGHVTFSVYDPNFPSAPQSLTYVPGTGFDPYVVVNGCGIVTQYNQFHFVGGPDIGAAVYFDSMFQQALQGFLSSPDLSVETPDEDTEVSPPTTLLRCRVGASLTGADAFVFDAEKVTAHVSVGSTFEQDVPVARHEAMTVAVLVGYDSSFSWLAAPWVVGRSAALVVSRAPEPPQLDPSSVTTFAYPGARYTYPYGVASNGRLGGTYQEDWPGWPDQTQAPHPNIHGFTFDGANWTRFDSAAPSTLLTEIRGINAAGDFVWYYNDNNVNLPFFADIGGTTVPISYPSASSTTANGIADDGTICGSCGISGSSRSFLLKAGVYTDISDPGYHTIIVQGISASNVAWGTARRGSDNTMVNFTYARGVFEERIDLPRTTVGLRSILPNGWILYVTNTGSFVYDGFTYSNLNVESLALPAFSSVYGGNDNAVYFWGGVVGGQVVVMSRVAFATP